MNPFSALNSPHDIRWQGTPSAHHKIFLIKTLFVVLAFIPLVIAEGVLFQKWWATTKFKNREDYSPYYFWLRIGMALIPDLLTSLITIILILNPLHKATISYHPIYALISSFCLFALYTNCAWLNWLVPYSNEVNFAGRDAWEKLCLAELAMESLVALMWFVMFVLACVATRRWDVGRRKCGNESIKMARVGGEESV